jgi:hypothetical protein
MKQAVIIRTHHKNRTADGAVFVVIPLKAWKECSAPSAATICEKSASHPLINYPKHTFSWSSQHWRFLC